MHRSSRLHAFIALLPMLVLTLACKDDNNGLRCSFKNPATFDTSSGWPKFRRDLRNSGTVALDATAYAQVAAGDPNSPASHDAIWVYPAVDDPADSAFVGSPVLNPREDTVYIGNTDGRLLGIHATGADAGTLLRIETDTGVRDFLASSEPFSIITAPLVATRDGIDAVFAGGTDARMIGVGEDGIALEDIWPGQLDAAAGSSPSITLDGTLVLGTFSSGLFATCPNGVGRFIVSLGTSLSAPAVARDASIRDEDEDEFLYFGGDDGLVRSVREDGILQWSFALSGPIVAAPVVRETNSEPPAVDAIFAIDANGTLAKLNAAGRAAAGFTRPAGIGRITASPALATHPTSGDRLYVASLDGRLYAVDAETGELSWSFDAGSAIESSPAVVLASDGNEAPIVVFGTDAGRVLYVRDAGGSAEQVGEFITASGASVIASPAVGSDGTVVVASVEGRVYALR